VKKNFLCSPKRLDIRYFVHYIRNGFSHLSGLSILRSSWTSVRRSSPISACSLVANDLSWEKEPHFLGTIFSPVSTHTSSYLAQVKLRMKRPTALLAILLAPVFADSQTNWQQYYPLHTGDFWEYQLYQNNIPIKNSVKVIGDTLMPNGLTYKIVRDTKHDGPYPGSQVSFTRVDMAGQVWEYSPFVCPDRLLYRLGAQVGDTLRNPCWPDSLTYWKLIEKSPAIVFGDSTEIQTWDWINSPLLGLKTLAGGFGLVTEQGEGIERYLQGAIINGRKYGEITVSVKRQPDGPSTAFLLHPNYPNPFNPSTTIEYQLPHEAIVRLGIFNLLGQEVATLTDSKRSLGRHQIVWNGRDRNGNSVGSGIYFYSLHVGQETITRKLILLR
jgi:hypothetical protein